jgi:hypothetical protein
MSANPRRAPIPLQPLDLYLPGEDELPYDFGPQMETSLHRSGMNELIDSLADWLADQGVTDTFVGGNLALYFSADQLIKNDFVGPDVFVARPTSTHPRKSWVVWRENIAPCVVIEMLSESTEKSDRTKKMKIYAQTLKVSEYYHFDPVDGRLEGYRLSQRAPAYVVIPPDPASEDPIVDCEQLQLRLGVRWDDSPHGEIPHLRWMTPSGAWVPTPAERARQEHQQKLEERQRADAEMQRAEFAEARVARLAAKQRADAEKQRADAADARTARLAAQLRALGIDPEG